MAETLAPFECQNKTPDAGTGTFQEEDQQVGQRKLQKKDKWRFQNFLFLAKFGKKQFRYILYLSIGDLDV
jgi:hypothetical protein